MYKLYCSILDRRLIIWAESNFKIIDEQNGFRKGRSPVGQLSSLTSIIETIETRQKKKLPTYCAFIDGTGSDKLESMVNYFNL